MRVLLLLLPCRLPSCPEGCPGVCLPASSLTIGVLGLQERTEAAGSVRSSRYPTQAWMRKFFNFSGLSLVHLRSRTMMLFFGWCEARVWVIAVESAQCTEAPWQTSVAVSCLLHTGSELANNSHCVGSPWRSCVCGGESSHPPSTWHFQLLRGVCFLPEKVCWHSFLFLENCCYWTLSR